MIRHVALAKYKDFAEGCTKKENIKKARQLTEELLKKVPTIQTLEVKDNIFYEGSFSYDTVTYSEYEDMEAVKKTLEHPAHKELNEFMGKVLESGCAVTHE